MRKKMSTAPFVDTPEQAEKLNQIIEKYKSDSSRLMAVMQEAQDVYGYLPFEVQERISEGMDIPMEKVYGVATFYAQFSLTPKGKFDVSVCLGTACYVKGAGDVFNKISDILGIKADECTEDGQFSLTACRCIGACGLAPVITINEDVYGKLSADDVAEILEKYKEK